MNEQQLHCAKARRESDRASLVRRLTEEGLWPQTSRDESRDLTAAVYAMLSRCPAPLLAVSLDDLALEDTPVNLPGVGPERYRSWSRRMKISIADLARSDTAGGVLNSMAERRSSRTPAHAG
jgi:4-alpha-glucanotransferase